MAKIHYKIGGGSIPSESINSSHVDDALKYLHSVGNAGDVSFTAQDEKQVVRKIDWMLLPLMAAMYNIQYLDKTILNYANVMGLAKDTNTSASQFSYLATAFYVGYLICEFPQGYVIQRVPLAKCLGINLVLCGVCVAASSAGTNYATLVILRVLLGCFESAISPSLMLLTSMWYKKSEQPIRIGIWFGSGGLSTIVGGLSSFGFQHYHGRIFKSWQIMFLVCGVVTILIGIWALLVFPDNPMSSGLTQREKLIAIERLRSNKTGIENKTFQKAQMFEALRDAKVLIIMVMVICGSEINGALANYQTSLIKSFGFGSKKSALLSVPTGVISILVCTSSTYVAGRTNQRLLVLACFLPLGIVGASLMAFLPTSARPGKMVGQYLTHMVPTTPIIYSIAAANFSGHTKKITVNALILISFSIGNIIGPLTFTGATAPDYFPAKIAMMCCFSGAFVLVFVLRFAFLLENKKRDERGEDNFEIDNAFLNITDIQNRSFRVEEMVHEPRQGLMNKDNYDPGMKWSQTGRSHDAYDMPVPKSFIMATTKHLTTHADFIIIGGGTAGLVLANRLTEDPNTQVLADFDAWCELGNSGWNWSSIAPYFKKSYTLLPPSNQATLDHLGIDWVNEDYRGKDGPIQVSFPGVIQNPLCKAWIDAFRGIGKATSGDPFSGNSVGGYSNAATVDPATKTRSYAASAYGLPFLHRPNFRVITDAIVHKINFENENGGITATEVILSAGVFNTPKILELSGIGKKQLLEKHSIPVVIPNPNVGEHLQDHLMTGVSFEVVDGIVTGDPLMRQEPEALQQAQSLYFEHKAGPFTIGGMQSHAFMPIVELANVEDRKVQELLDGHHAKPEDREHCDIVQSIIQKPDECSAAWLMFLAQVNLHEAGTSFVGNNLLPGNFASFGVSQSHPFSRGSTHIASANINDNPLIDPNYFSHPADLEIMARHLQEMETLRNTKELSPFFKPDGKRNHPDAYKISTLEGAKKYILDTALTTYHTCGSAAMLPKEKGGVVDDKLVVYGTTNLRIVDASIFPLIPRGNIISSVYAVAEKAADIIKGV
ncbi:MFS general substrate transporter [Glarea lozoyensis ATCC 20868]|uniref:MFS general substrate transporter n=1 Tax=Glarea lozoyensis (strain ATCC 20868 / MF5171) TaxID=1116229 RepID=S3CEB3_GLAL2|nr:MFS general substrate transporter [Glarea lozoyensis ATCC 20868]EPE24797.1 MFS general substrate transporter [Glarea lozoyensis ATCC 20868]